MSLLGGSRIPLVRPAAKFVPHPVVCRARGALRARGPRGPIYSAALEEMRALVEVGRSKSEREVLALVDAFCAEHGATMEMLTALKELEEADMESSGAIEVVAARLTSHLLGVLTDSGSLVVQETRERLVKDLALTSELEATMIARKAESVLQLIGRKAISPDDLHVQIPDQSAAVRILEVMMQVEDSEERLGLLNDAFDSGETREYEDDEEQEGLWTTPMVLYQAIKERLSTARGPEAEVLCELKEAILRDHMKF